MSKTQNQSILKYLLPASEQSKSDFYEQCKFLTNWDTTEHHGWKLPGTSESHDWCGIWKTVGCLNAEKHRQLGHDSVVFVKQFQRSCYRAACKECDKKWMGRQSNRSTRRIEKYSKITGRKPFHIVLSVSDWDVKLPFPEMKKKARKILFELGVIGCGLIFHPFRFNKRIRCWYYSPHFHAVGFGRIDRIAEVFYKNNRWYILDLGIRKSVFNTFYYLLTHCGIKKHFHALSWLGDLSYCKLKVEKEPQISKCPACGAEFVEIYYNGFDPHTPPDQYFEGFVDSDGWYLVHTMSEEDYLQPKYQYASTRDLDELLKGLTFAN